MLLVYRHLAVIGPESSWAAEASECAGEQGKFWDYHDLLYQRQGGENQGAFNKDRLKGFAVDVGLDTVSFNSCFDSGRYRAAVEQEKAQGQSKGVRYTPTFFVDGEKIEGAVLLATLRPIIETHLQERR